MKYEYRLYYDKNGDPITYTTLKLKGKKFIVISLQEYLECRFDVKVVDKKIVRVNHKKIITKFEQSDVGVKCSEYDINILMDDSDQKNRQWKLVTHELR